MIRAELTEDTRPGRSGAERGSASIEFVFSALILLVPTLYLAVSLANIQIAEGAARSAAIGASRSWAREGDAAAAERIAQQTFQERLADPGAAGVELSCQPRPCHWPEGIAGATVTVTVALPGVPSLPGVPAMTTVRAEAEYPVARFGREGRPG